MIFRKKVAVHFSTKLWRELIDFFLINTQTRQNISQEKSHAAT